MPEYKGSKSLPNAASGKYKTYGPRTTNASDVGKSSMGRGTSKVAGADNSYVKAVGNDNERDTTPHSSPDPHTKNYR